MVKNAGGTVVALVLTAATFIFGGPIAGAVCLFLAGCVAALAWTPLGDYFGLRQHDEPPQADLRLSFVPPQTYVKEWIADLPGHPWGYFCHVFVSNASKDAVARGCVGRLVKLERKNGRGEFVPDVEFRSPVRLKWANEHHGATVDIEHDVPRLLDLCFGIQGVKQALIATRQGPTGSRTHLDIGSYRALVRVTADNAPDADRWFRVKVDGTWDQIKVTQEDGD